MFWQLSVTLLLFGIKEAMCGIDPKRVYFPNDSQRFVHVGSRWLSEMVLLLCKHMVRRRWKMLKFYHTVATETCLTVSVNEQETTKLPVPHFSQFHVNNDDITIVMRHACERASYTYSHVSEIGTEERLLHIDSFKTKIFEFEFNDIFAMVYDTPGTEEIKYESAQIWIRMVSPIYLGNINLG